MRIGRRRGLRISGPAVRGAIAFALLTAAVPAATAIAPIPSPSTTSPTIQSASAPRQRQITEAWDHLERGDFESAERILQPLADRENVDASVLYNLGVR
ncbi:MAG: hypothetical protein ACYTFH_09285 [Planctomycetota bacterium]|jgi:hypothetical protein